MGHTKESFRKNALQIVIRYTCDLRHALCLSLFVVNNIQNITVSEYQKKKNASNIKKCSFRMEPDSRFEA